MAGVADPTDTFLPPTVFTLKESPQPGMNIGVLKNHKQMRMMNRTNTCASCRFIDPSASYFSLITFIAFSSCSFPFLIFPPASHWIEIKVVVGVKYIKMLDKKLE